MALEPEQVRKLTAPFPYTDHEFNPRGFVYITEEAIAARLDEVDPSWEFVVTDMVRDMTSATVTGRLTIGGVTREGVGTQSIEYVKGNDGNVKTDAVGQPVEAGEPRKGAATDAFKRAARLFGIGRYLLGAPKQADFQAWLTKLSTNGWTRDQADALIAKAKANGLEKDALLGLLGVKLFTEYTPGPARADELLTAHIAARSNGKAVKA